MSEENPSEIPEITRRYFDGLFQHVDTDLAKSMPSKLLVYMAHQILVSSYPALAHASYFTLKHGSKENVDFLMEGVAAALNHVMAKGWHDINKAGIILAPLPNEFARYLEVPNQGPFQWK